MFVIDALCGSLNLRRVDMSFSCAVNAEPLTFDSISTWNGAGNNFHIVIGLSTTVIELFLGRGHFCSLHYATFASHASEFPHHLSTSKNLKYN